VKKVAKKSEDDSLLDETASTEDEAKPV